MRSRRTVLNFMLYSALGAILVGFLGGYFMIFEKSEMLIDSVFELIDY